MPKGIFILMIFVVNDFNIYSKFYLKPNKIFYCNIKLPGKKRNSFKKLNSIFSDPSYPSLLDHWIEMGVLANSSGSR